METLKIWFTDFWPEWSEEDFITPILKKHFGIVLDKKNPDVLFHSIFNRMRDTPNYKCKKVLILAENWRPEQFKSDYSISFDPHSDSNYRLPLWQIYLLLLPELKDRLYNRVNHKEEDFVRWCAFTVSNPSNFIRNSAYHKLSEYKKVHSYGRYMTNDPILQNYSKGKYWRSAKDKFFLANPHKFMLTYENTPYRYYCTEKLMDAFLVGAMPIYWGDPKVVEDWNKDAFINAQKIGDRWVDVVKEINNEDSLYNYMYTQSIFTEEQKKKLEDNLANFESWLIEKIKI
jgi:hypothetical protein